MRYSLAGLRWGEMTLKKVCPMKFALPWWPLSFYSRTNLLLLESISSGL